MTLISIRLLCQGRQAGFHGLVAARTRQAGEDEPWTPLRKAVFAVALREGDERGRHRIEAPLCGPTLVKRRDDLTISPHASGPSSLALAYLRRSGARQRALGRFGVLLLQVGNI